VSAIKKCQFDLKDIPIFLKRNFTNFKEYSCESKAGQFQIVWTVLDAANIVSQHNSYQGTF